MAVSEFFAGHDWFMPLPPDAPAALAVDWYLRKVYAVFKQVEDLKDALQSLLNDSIDLRNNSGAAKGHEELVQTAEDNLTFALESLRVDAMGLWSWYGRAAQGDSLDT